MRSLFTCISILFTSFFCHASDIENSSLATDLSRPIEDTVVIALQENHKDSEEARRVLEQLSLNNLLYLSTHRTLGPNSLDKYIFNHTFSESQWEALVLTDAIFINCSFENNFFSWAGKFENTTFLKCNFNQCEFKDYWLTDCRFLHCSFNDVFIKGCVINNCMIIRSLLQNVKLYKLDIDICTLIEGKIVNTKIKRCHVKNNYLQNCFFDEKFKIYSNCTVENTTIENSHIKGDFSNSNFKNIYFKSCFLSNISWDADSLTADNIDVSGCKIHLNRQMSNDREAVDVLRDIQGFTWEEENPPSTFLLMKRPYEETKTQLSKKRK